MASNEQVNLVVQATDQATATLRKVSGEVDNLSGNLKSFTDKAKEMAKSLAVVGTAVAAFGVASVQKFSEVGDAIEKMANRTGLSAEAVSTLRFAADQAGTSIDSVEMGVKAMQRTMVEASAGNENLTKRFKELGFSLEEIRAMKPEEQFQQLGYRISEISDPALRTATAMEIFGKSGSDLLPLFGDMEEGIGTITARARTMGVVMDTETAAKAAKLNDTIGELKAQFLGIQLQIGEALMPVVIKMNEEWLPAAITGWKNLYENINGDKWIPQVIAGWKNLGANVTGVINDIRSAIDAVVAAYERMQQKISGGIGNVAQSFRNLPANLGFRAEGGPVGAGQPYIVGERGPELFVPGMSGTIVPNGAMVGAGGGVNVYITGNNISSAADIGELARRVGDEVMRTLKKNTRI